MRPAARAPGYRLHNGRRHPPQAAPDERRRSDSAARALVPPPDREAKDSTAVRLRRTSVHDNFMTAPVRAIVEAVVVHTHHAKQIRRQISESTEGAGSVAEAQ